MAHIQVPADGVGKRVDTVTLTDALAEVHRQKIVLAGGSGTAEVVVVTDSAPAGSDMGLVVRHAGTATIAGTVNVNGGVAISGTAIVAGTVNVNGGVAISGTAQVALGTPIVVNNISATTTVAGNVNISTMPAVTLAADQVLGSISRTVQVAVGTPFTLQGISTTVQVAIATPFILQGISTTVQVAIATPFILQGISTTVTVAGNVNISTMPAITLAAGQILDSISATVGVKGQVSLAAGTSNIGFINNISATVTVAGNVNISATPSVILAAGTANFGTLNDISRTVQVAVGTPFIIQGISTTVTCVVAGYTPAVMAASHGPKCVTCSTSSVVTLVASPGAGANIYVTQLMVGNFSGTLTRARIGTSASGSTIVQPLAASGGGFVLHFDPPWMLSASEACVCSVKPNVADAFFTVNFFVR